LDARRFDGLKLPPTWREISAVEAVAHRAAPNNDAERKELTELAANWTACMAKASTASRQRQEQRRTRNRVPVTQ